MKYSTGKRCNGFVFQATLTLYFADIVGNFYCHKKALGYHDAHKMNKPIRIFLAGQFYMKAWQKSRDAYQVLI
jgi:hypothetical protein